MEVVYGKSMRMVSSKLLFEEYDFKGDYENLITGDMTKGTPKFHKGGILADDMGLGKTIVPEKSFIQFHTI